MRFQKVLVILIGILLLVSACAKKADSSNQEAATTQAVVNSQNIVDADLSLKSTQDTAAASLNTTSPNASLSSATPLAKANPAVSTTKKTKVVVIDPGHADKANLETEPNAPGSTVMKIKDGGGTQGINTKTPEYVINMAVAIKLKTLLEQRGFTVVMTKTANSTSLGNVERAEIGNNAKANLVIRIHADGSENAAVSGLSMLIPQGINDNTNAIADESRRCGQIVLNNLVTQVGMKNRGLDTRSDMTGFNWSKVPVILLEMGFLSNPEEDKLLNSAGYQDKLVKAIAEGISEALK